LTMKTLTLDRLYEIMSNVLMLPDFEFSQAMAASDIPNWDSLNHSVLMMEISSEIGLQISAEDAAKQKSIGELFTFICEQLAASNLKDKRRWPSQ
jgi:acyl carrier protein